MKCFTRLWKPGAVAVLAAVLVTSGLVLKTSGQNDQKPRECDSCERAGREYLMPPSPSLISARGFKPHPISFYDNRQGLSAMPHAHPGGGGGAGGGGQTAPHLKEYGAASWGHVVTLAHPLRTDSPLFPGDPPFTINTWASIEDDGYLLEQVSFGTHTGTHVSAPCHFVEGQKCVDDLPPEMFIRPAAVIDVRERTAIDPDFQLSRADIRDWESEHGRIRPGSVVLLLTGFGDHYFEPSYFGTAPGLSGAAVRWLMRPVADGGRGAAGTGSDTFGPDATSDATFSASYETFLAGGVTLENLTNLDRLRPNGDTIVFLPARIDGSGFQTNVIGLRR